MWLFWYDLWHQHWRVPSLTIKAVKNLAAEICSIIALMLGRLRMSVTECIAAYVTMSEKVFGQPQNFTQREGVMAYTKSGPPHHQRCTKNGPPHKWLGYTKNGSHHRQRFHTISWVPRAQPIIHVLAYYSLRRRWGCNALASTIPSGSLLVWYWTLSTVLPLFLCGMRLESQGGC